MGFVSNIKKPLEGLSDPKAPQSGFDSDLNYQNLSSKWWDFLKFLKIWLLICFWKDFAEGFPTVYYKECLEKSSMYSTLIKNSQHHSLISSHFRNLHVLILDTKVRYFNNFGTFCNPIKIMEDSFGSNSI